MSETKEELLRGEEEARRKEALRSLSISELFEYLPESANETMKDILIDLIIENDFDVE